MLEYLLALLAFIVMYGIYQLFWYYPKKMRALFGLDQKQPFQSKGSRKHTPVTEEDFEKMFQASQRIAHRGSRAEGLPENSIAAFKCALQRGNADVIECDVWLTKDHEIVIHHDESLLRMTGVDTLVHHVNYADLPPLLTTIPNQSERIQDYLTTVRNNLNDIIKIPTLREVLEVLPEDRFIDIEFKQLSPELIMKVNDLIYELGKEKQVYWFSLDERINKSLKLYNHELPSIVSVQSVFGILFYYYTGILPFINLTDKVFGITLDEITLEKVKHEKATKDLPAFVQAFIAWIFQGRPPKIMVAQKLFTHLRRRGIPVWFLGVDSEEDVLFAMDVGATAVFTDRIEWLNATLEKISKIGNKRFKKLYE